MNKLKNLLRVLPGKAAVRAVLALMFVAASLPLFAQTAEVRYAGVFYKDGATGDSVNNMYCDWADPDSVIKKFKTASSTPSFYTGSSIGGSTLNVNGTGTDGDYIVQLIQKTVSSSPSGAVGRSNSTNYSLYRMIYKYFYYDHDGDSSTATVLRYDIYQIIGYASSTSGYQFEVNADKTNTANRSFISTPKPTNNANSTDPWASSALIEYDQPYPNVTPSANKYPNHCVALCMNVYCQNKPIGGSTYSISFPLQQVKFDIVKYYNNKNIANPEESPAVRTIDLYPNVESARCASYSCPGGTTSGNTCSSALYYSTSTSTSPGANCYSFEDGSLASNKCSCTNCDDDGNGCSCNFAVFNGNGTPSIGNQSIPFCAAWDGSYEIAGEFGKSNGQFGFRATVATDVPGDNVITDKIEFNSTIAYPGENQIPLQVDVTNVHTVRSTPTVVGNITAVSAQPYTYAYRLSKDSDVRIAVFDASTGDNLAYGFASSSNPTGSTGASGETTIVSTAAGASPSR